MKNKIIAFVALALAISTESKSRDQIKIVGSSTVYPFATVVAERFGKTSGFKTPVIESTGSGGGLKLFCKGLGTQHPDITNASRRIKLKEVKNCEKNGVSDITEIKVGFDGIAIANAKSGPSFDLTLRDLYLALAKEVPSDKEGKEVKANPYKMWNEVNPKLPAKPIVVIGPPPPSGTTQLIFCLTSLISQVLQCTQFCALICKFFPFPSVLLTNSYTPAGQKRVSGPEYFAKFTFIGEEASLSTR